MHNAITKSFNFLFKGDIFGQLLGTAIRPIRITATADEMVDLLYITVKEFQKIITEEVFITYYALFFCRMPYQIGF